MSRSRPKAAKSAPQKAKPKSKVAPLPAGETSAETHEASPPADDPALLTRYRRARTVALAWEGGSLGGGNFFAGTFERLDPRDAWVLDALNEWTTPPELAKKHPIFEGSAPMALVELERLAQAALVVREGEDEPGARFADAWSEWGVGTQIFHATSKDAPYTETPEDGLAVFQKLVRQPEGAPPAWKTYPDALRVELPDEDELPRLDVPLETALASRRTWRAFTGQEVSLRRVAKLLHTAFGITGLGDAGPLGTLVFKTSPSGGARHPVEAYLVALAVEGVPRGIYHYDARGHALERLSLGDHREDMIRWLSNQGWFARSSFAIFLTGVVRRVSFKYKHGRAYRVMLMDAGHIAQTFVLAATALGLGAWQTAALHDGEVEQALGVDGCEEVVLYCVGAGVPPIPSLYVGKSIELWGDRDPKRVEMAPPG